MVFKNLDNFEILKYIYNYLFSENSILNKKTDILTFSNNYLKIKENINQFLFEVKMIFICNIF